MAGTAAELAGSRGPQTGNPVARAPKENGGALASRAAGEVLPREARSERGHTGTRTRVRDRGRGDRGSVQNRCQLLRRQRVPRSRRL